MDRHGEIIIYQAENGLTKINVIIFIGYRVNSQRGVQFRIWATNVLKEYMIKGFAIDDERLKGNGGGRYWKELFIYFSQ